MASHILVVPLSSLGVLTRLNSTIMLKSCWNKNSIIKYHNDINFEPETSLTQGYYKPLCDEMLVILIHWKLHFFSKTSTCAVNIYKLTFKVGSICVLLASIISICIPFLPVNFANCF